MDNSTKANPLSKHFRQPILYVKLPSQGKWYPENTIDLPVTGEIPIYAMTARDEITMKTPDALLNGSSTAHVLQSCCPNIKDPWKMPLVDLDTLLIAIRIATYGKEMEFVAVCPHCGTKNEQGIDLSVLLSKIALGNWSQTVKTNDLEIVLKPQSYEEYNKNNIANFEEQRILKIVQDTEMSEDEKVKQFDELFQKLIETGIEQVSKSIAYIKINDGTVVNDRNHIREFLDNCDKGVWDSIKEILDGIKSTSNYSNVTLTCSNEECGKSFVTPFVFEQTNFFG
jgi:hypothetical protein